MKHPWLGIAGALLPTIVLAQTASRWKRGSHRNRPFKSRACLGTLAKIEGVCARGRPAAGRFGCGLRDRPAFDHRLNAAIPGPIGPFWETDPEQWWRTLDANLRRAMLCSRAALPGMIARGKGRIINIASSALPIAYFSSCATSKAALVRCTQSIAGEVKPYSVSLFAVGPGTVRTSMAEHFLRSHDGQRWLPWFKRIFDEGLDVSVERPSRLVLELASGRADGLSGRFLSIWDDSDLLLRNVREIEERHLYSLRVQTLDGGGVGSALAAIRAEAERPVEPEPQDGILGTASKKLL